ncbi:MAG TPA: 2-hydroxyacid dehydrogenase [Candidatus Saccharimonadales bacterium]|nr:2-hydroxyacid dehydrogenase [Candidatus Saccharimonadales bacterium]
MKFNKLLVYNIDKSSSLDPQTWKKIESLTNRIVFVPKDPPQALKRELKDTDGILVNFGTTISKEEIDNAPHLKYIGVMATAFGKIDVAHAKKKKVLVSNLKGYSTESVAEFVIASILEHARGLEEGKKRGKAGNVSEAGISAIELKGKNFGIVGLGDIGKRVAEIALGFGADVRYWSKHRKKDFEKKGVTFESLEKLVSDANILSINLAQTKETEGIFNKNIFNKIKSGTIIVNTAPMELIVIKDLAERLKKGDIIFILDHSDEMDGKDLKNLLKYPNCVVYPPIAYISNEAAENKKSLFLGNIQGFLNGKPQNIVN